MKVKKVSVQTQETLFSTENLSEIIDANSKLYFKIKNQVDRSKEKLDLINKVIENNLKLNGDRE
jgi:hypothetical protein